MITNFTNLNDPNTPLYKKVLQKQNEYIDERLKTIKIRFFENNIKFSHNTKEELAKFLNLGIAQNLVQNFFKYKENECLICNKNYVRSPRHAVY